MTPTQIKICGVTNANDARACIELGANMIGFNFYPHSPRYIEPEAVRGIVDALPRGICAVGVFVDADAGEISKTAELVGVRCLQLHGDFASKTCSELAREFRVIRAFSTDTRFHPENAAAFSDCDVLVDTYHADLRGGTGQTCDWPAARATSCSVAGSRSASVRSIALESSTSGSTSIASARWRRQARSAS